MAEVTAEPQIRERSALGQYWAQLWRDPLGISGLILVILLVSSAIFASWIVPYDPNRILVGQKLIGPSAEHWMGTDHLGRDLFSRVIMGGRIALQVPSPRLRRH